MRAEREAELLVAERRFDLALREGLRAVVGRTDIRTVAERARLSPELVSATLQGGRVRVTPGTYARICAAMGARPEQALLSGLDRVTRILAEEEA